jgi:PAS domain S-box-containing protein
MKRQRAIRASSSISGAPSARLPSAAEAAGSSAQDRALLDAAFHTERRRKRDAPQLLFENSPDALFVVWIDIAEEFHLEGFNPAFARLFGIGSHRAHGDTPHQLLPATIAGRFAAALLRCKQSGAPTRLDLSLASDGGIVHWEFLLVPVTGFLGRLERITGHGHLRRTDQALGSDEVSVQDCIARTTRDVLYVLDRSMKRNLFLNARVHDVLGYAADEVHGMTREALKALVHPDDLPRVNAHYRKLDLLPYGAVMSIEYRVRHADGHYVWLASRDTVLVSGRNGGISKIVGCATDISDQRHALAEVKKVSKQLLRTQDEERRRIARELHDSTCQHLVAAGIGLTRLGMINQRAPDSDIGRDDVLDIIADARKSIDQAQHEIRALSYLLHPPVLERMGLSEALRRFAAGFARRTRIRVDLTIQDELVCRSRDIATALLRVAQEALVNVYRHAEASQVAVRLVRAEGWLTLEIEDNGKGIGQANTLDLEDIDTIGVGIPGMRARVRQFRGELEVTSRDSGVLVRATIPARALSLNRTPIFA